jgi:nitrate/TMAO reductase-like tetraheme cytochrome c subunit
MLRRGAFLRAPGIIATAVAIWVLALVSAARSAEPAAAGRRLQAAPQAQAPEASQPAPPANSDCFACHEDDSAARADGRPVVVKTAVFEKSVHGALACVDCHADLARAELPHPEKLAKVDCATCHAEPVQQYAASVHATARASGTDVAATCVDCHGMHDIRRSKDPESRTYHFNVAVTCARCHGNAEIIAKGKIPSDVTKAFADSIHGRALSRSGLIVAPTCSDCHGAHDIRRPTDPESRVSSRHVPATCGTCHEGIERQFETSTHGRLLAQGAGGGPACQTCHTAHGIQRTESAGWQLSVIGQCGTCHADRIETFRDTFHGQVTSLGFRTVAGCADCHGVHEILPASDPRSPISPGRLVETCGKCHEGANASFVQYDPHANKHDRRRSPLLFYTTRFMNVLLAGVFGFFGLHTTMWFAKELRVRRGRRRGASR